MRTVGLIGGLSWHSSVIYYRRINELVQAERGGNHAARLLLHSVDFQEIETAQLEGRWQDMADEFAGIARRLVSAGAEAIAILANTMHKVAPEVTAAVDVPFLSILDCTADALKARGITRAALFGTRTTMRAAFYREALEARGLSIRVPDERSQERVHTMIHQEVMGGRVGEGTRAEFVAMIERMAEEGAEAAILGCTELPLLVSQADTPCLLVDTLEEHARAIARFALSEA